MLKWYAPGTSLIGLHFKEYDDFIKTPVIRKEMRNTEVRNNGHYTVYLPSYDDTFLCEILKRIDVPWEVFSKHYKGESYRDGNIRVSPVDGKKFVESFSSCEGIITNAGFETPSEALYFGKKLLAIPMKRQYEQECNAEALKQLGIKVVYSIGPDFEKVVAGWIDSSFIYHADYGNNLPELAEMILAHASDNARVEEPLTAKEIEQ